MLAGALAKGVGIAAHLAGGVLGSGVASAAVASVQAVLGQVGGGSPATTLIGSGGTTTSGIPGGLGATLGQGSGGDALQAGQASNMQYLDLQIRMQQESQQFQSLSNILKVRHDSAKAAINNIR